MSVVEREISLIGGMKFRPISGKIVIFLLLLYEMTHEAATYT